MGPEQEKVIYVSWMHTSINEVVIKVTEVKWGKMRSLVLEMETLMIEDRVTHKILECI